METINNLKKDKDIRIRYNKKTYIIKVSEELKINPDIINRQLKELPSSYYWLCEVRNDYIRKRDQAEREMKHSYSKAWILAKQSDSKCSNDMAEHKAETNQKYQSKYDEWIKLSKKASDLISLCKSYESRENILRTLSANFRKER